MNGKFIDLYVKESNGTVKRRLIIEFVEASDTEN